MMLNFIGSLGIIRCGFCGGWMWGMVRVEVSGVVWGYIVKSFFFGIKLVNVLFKEI